MKILASIALAFLLASCHRITEGTIVDFKTIPAHTESNVMFIWTSSNTMIPIFTEDEVPAKYNIQVVSDDHRFKEWFEVNLNYYSNAKIGDRFKSK